MKDVNLTKSITAIGYAKINLLLKVYKPTINNYHRVFTVMQTITLKDIVRIYQSDSLKISLASTSSMYQNNSIILSPQSVLSTFPLDETNLAVKALKLISKIARTRIDSNIEIIVEKNIPIAAGLAGGSADAAAVLVAVNQFWNLGFKRQQLIEIAAKLGADVPFALHGKTAIGNNYGERLTSVLVSKKFYWVIAISPVSLSTSTVYKEFDKINSVNSKNLLDFEHEARTSIANLLKILAFGTPKELAPLLQNDLQTVAISLLPSLDLLLKAGVAAGALKGIVSGSGPTCIFLCENRNMAVEVATELSSMGLCKSIKVVSSPAFGAQIE